jgi:hypothetical protein
MEEKKYFGLNGLTALINGLKQNYAQKKHSHELSDLADYVVDSELSSSSANPIENQVVSAEFDSVKSDLSDTVLKVPQTLTSEELTQVRKNLKFIGKDVSGQSFTVNNETLVASPNAEIFGDYDNNIAIGQWSIAEGSQTIAKGRACHAEGALTQALVDGTHVEGYGTKATGYWSHAEGELTNVTSYASHAEGSYCTMPDGTKRYGTAAGYASHIEGGGCHATGSCSHAEGLGTTVSGYQSHVEGRYTTAAGNAQHVEGIANIEDTNSEYIHIAGNGTSPTDRSNAYTLDWDGNGWFAGSIYVGGTGMSDASEIATKSDIPVLDEITKEEIIEMFAE